MQLISGFIDTDLTLNPVEESIFKSELNTFLPQEQENVMEIVTSWMRQGIEQGIMREKNLVIRLIERKLGTIEPEIKMQIQRLKIEEIEALGEAIFDFANVEALRSWLNQ